MSGSVAFSRHIKLETIQVQQETGLDGQGKPAFGTAASIDVRVVRQDRVVIRGDGSSLRTALTVWVPGDATTLPDERWRVAYSGEYFIAEEAKDVKDRNAELVHRRLRCRRE